MPSSSPSSSQVKMHIVNNNNKLRLKKSLFRGKSLCRGKKQVTCKKVKGCKFARGTKRAFCRKIKSRRR